MHPPRFAPPNNFIPHRNPWRPHGPRFRPNLSMQHRNNYTTEHSFPNNNEVHWCETCDRGFRTLEILLNHKQQHQKCNIDGCQFIAHPKVITKHIQMQHSTGLYKKIAKLDNPEEIQKWREERKKKYPTKENIEKRNAEIKEKIDRGEKMGMRNHRENKHNRREPSLKRKFSNDNNRKNFKRRFQGNKSPEPNNKTVTTDIKKNILPPKKENKLVATMDDSRTLKPFTGIMNLLEDIDKDEDVKENIEVSDSIEEDQYIVMDDLNDKNNLNVTEPVVCGALSLLIGNYESSDEDSNHQNPQLDQNQTVNLKVDNNATEQTEINKSKIHLNTNVNVKNDLEKSDDDSGPEEAEIVKGISTERNTNSPNICIVEQSKVDACKKEGREKADRNSTNNTKNTRKFFKPKIPSTLLEKLLRNEIRQERNIVLQCIRYIIKNNYFEKDLSSKSN